VLLSGAAAEREPPCALLEQILVHIEQPLARREHRAAARVPQTPERLPQAL
jgi:hypothetical protein